MTKTKEYRVIIEAHWSAHYAVKAKSSADAKKKAWERFKKRPNKKLFSLYADKNS